MCFICAGRDFNRALLSGLIAEERVRQLLDINVGEHDYKVALSEENLRASQLWAFVEERPGTAGLPVDLLLTLLRLRHSIHVVFGGSDLRPLTVEELLLAEDLMSGWINIPSAKEAKVMIKGVRVRRRGRKRGRGWFFLTPGLWMTLRHTSRVRLRLRRLRLESPLARVLLSRLRRRPRGNHLRVETRSSCPCPPTGLFTPICLL